MAVFYCVARANWILGFVWASKLILACIPSLNATRHIHSQCSDLSRASCLLSDAEGPFQRRRTECYIKLILGLHQQKLQDDAKHCLSATSPAHLTLKRQRLGKVLFSNYCSIFPTLMLALENRQRMVLLKETGLVPGKRRECRAIRTATAAVMPSPIRRSVSHQGKVSKPLS